MARFALALALAFSSLLAGALPARADDGVITIFIAPLGPVPEQLLDEVSQAVRREYAAEVVRLPGAPLPRSAYHPDRRAYQGDTLLDHLERLVPADAHRDARILGVTAADIWTPREKRADKTVFGLGALAGRAALVSSFRLRRGARDHAQLAFRMGTNAIHQVGHTLGLNHCAEPACAMLDPAGSLDITDAGSGHLGHECRRVLATTAVHAPP